MGLDDFASSGTRPATQRALAPEDEDLFDFPVIEMTLESEKPLERHAPELELPPVAAVEDEYAVQTAAELVEDIEDVLDAELDAPSSPFVPQEAQRPARGLLAASSPLVLLGGMLALNLLTFGFLWFVSHTFRSGIQELRDEMLHLSHAAAIVQASTSATPQPPVAQTTLEPAPEKLPAHPLEAFEQTTLALAAEEIGAGQFQPARQRLSRLLALADRIDAELKDDIEARARFLIGESYYAQARAKSAPVEPTPTPTAPAGQEH